MREQSLDLILRFFTFLSDWARCSKAFRHHSHHPGFEVQVFLSDCVFQSIKMIRGKSAAFLCPRNSQFHNVFQHGFVFLL